MQTCIHTYTHIQIHSKHIINLGLSYFGAEGVDANGDGAPSVGAHNVGAYGAPNAGAPSVGISLYQNVLAFVAISMQTTLKYTYPFLLNWLLLSHLLNLALRMFFRG